MQKKIIELLDKYIEKYKTTKQKQEQTKNELFQSRTKQILYEEIINILDKNDLENAILLIPLLLNTIYENNTYVDEFYNILYSPQYDKKLNDFLLKIKDEYNKQNNYTKLLKSKIDILISEINKMYYNYQSAKIAKRNFLLKKPILNLTDIHNVKKIIEYYSTEGEISPKEKLLLINEIELYNRNLTAKNSSEKERIYNENLHDELSNILMMGFQEPDIITVPSDKKNTLNKITKEIINQSIQLDSQAVIELLKEYQKYELDQNEYNYILVEIIKYYIDELLTIHSLFLESPDAINRKTRLEYISNYYNNLDKYIKINEFYEKINEYIKEESDLTDEDIKNFTNEKRLIYSHLETNISKAKIIQDMNDIPYEYYQIIQELLFKFKNGTIGINKIKRIKYNSRNSGYIELKDDQVRIILKHVKDDIYNVYGVFAKKDNNDMNAYRKIMNRPLPQINTNEKLQMQLELSKLTEEELEKLINDKGRKNSR